MNVNSKIVKRLVNHRSYSSTRLIESCLHLMFLRLVQNERPEPYSWVSRFLLILLSSQRGAQMKHMIAVVAQLKKEREHTQRQLERIDEALAALGNVGLNGSRTMSAAGRRKISLAQKARWAKHKAVGHAAKPKRTISAAGRKRIAAAQRARWAKVKKAA